MTVPSKPKTVKETGSAAAPATATTDGDSANLLNGRISRSLKALRRRDKLTQEEVARGVGVSWRNYQRWEKGRVTPRPESVVELAAFFGVTEREIYGFDPAGADAGQKDGELVEELLNTIAVLVPRVDRLTLRVAELERQSPDARAS